jgi:hypothetical protein
MRWWACLICFLLPTLAGCSAPQNSSLANNDSEDRQLAWPKNFANFVGKSVTLECTAANTKLGAILLEEGQSKNEIWIEGLECWPQGFFGNGVKGKRLRVTGAVIKRDDVPVFIQKPGEAPQGGIPVRTEEELEIKKWRFLLQGAKWTVLE